MSMAAAIRAGLTRMDFTGDAAHTIMTAQGYNALTELALLTDAEVEHLCKKVCCPGGMIANPAQNVQGQPATIPNPGIAISLRAEDKHEAIVVLDA